MSCLQARTGRHKQRYEGPFRLVAGCIPYKLKSNVEDESSNVEENVLVLMISTPNHDDLVFPKGGWENDESVTEAACREAMEEAGVKGILDENPLGVWDFRSKSNQNSCSKEGGCRGYMFALEVTDELDSWPEHSIYKRKWLCTEEAYKVCRYDWMRDALTRLVTSLSKGKRETPPDTDTAESQSSSPACTLQDLDESCTIRVVQV